MSLASDVLTGDRLALSRLLSQVENGKPEGRGSLDELFSHTGHAHLIGITGAPGTGKSSLVNHLVRAYRHPEDGKKPRSVAVIAIDPSSPFTGGALLGDRVRMRDLAGDPGVFIRSMASRGSLGGLAITTAEFVQVFDAAGYDIILIETVGVGQSEVDIAHLAHTTLVIDVPGLGDDIQAIKAGILEIADILIINKADLPGVENTERALRNMLELAHPVSHHFHHQLSSNQIQPQERSEQTLWIPPICLTIATEGKGIHELIQTIGNHRQHLKETGEWKCRERERLETDFENLLYQTLVTRWRAGIPDEHYQSLLDILFERHISPHEAIVKLLQDEDS